MDLSGERTFTLTVTVIDDEADPIPGVTLTAQLVDGDTRQVETDEEGRGRSRPLSAK